jgi:hypothetical protein
MVARPRYSAQHDDGEQNFDESIAGFRSTPVGGSVHEYRTFD